MANILMIIAPRDFRDEELFDTKEELEKAGNTTVVASTSTGTIYGSHGGDVEVNTLLTDVNVQDYDAVAFIGGSGTHVLFNNTDAHNIARNAYESGKLVAAICIAPVILANAGLLQDKQVTVFEDGIDAVETKGAHYTGLGVTVDGQIVTASGPQQAHAFGRKLADLLN